MKTTTTGPVPFLTWHREGSEIAALATQEFQGKTLVHLRIYSRGVNGKLYATARGITIPDDKITPLRKALRKVKKELKREKDRKRSQASGGGTRK
jgi:hypothetical protein